MHLSDISPALRMKLHGKISSKQRDGSRPFNHITAAGIFASSSTGYLEVSIVMGVPKNSWCLSCLFRKIPAKFGRELGGALWRNGTPHENSGAILGPKVLTHPSEHLQQHVPRDTPRQLQGSRQRRLFLATAPYGPVGQGRLNQQTATNCNNKMLVSQDFLLTLAVSRFSCLGIPTGCCCVNGTSRKMQIE